MPCSGSMAVNDVPCINTRYNHKNAAQNIHGSLVEVIKINGKIFPIRNMCSISRTEAHLHMNAVIKDNDNNTCC